MKSLNLNSSKMAAPIEVGVFAFFVLFVLVAGLLLQLVVLPLTPWHASDGLMIGGDWVLFQDVALKHAAEIRELGWSVAQLRPEGHGPSGLAAFVYAVTGVSKPWVLLPIHAVVYALAAVGLFWIVQGLSGSNRLALWALAPLCMMPSLAMVWGQIHKDVWAIAAVLLILGFWMRLFIGQSLRIWIGSLVLVFANLSLWWMRPYTLQIVFVGQTVLIFSLIYLACKKRLFKPLIIGLAALIFTYTTFAGNKIYSQEISQATSSAAAQSNEEIVSNFCKDWQMTLPIQKLDSMLMTISCARDGLMGYFPNAKSNIDAEVAFSSAKDVIAYLPRAAKVGALTPFPNMWFAAGTTEASRIFRLISAVETMAMYVALLGITFMLALTASGQISIGLEKAVALLALLGFAMVWVGVYSLVTGNLGSLYRVRFPIMLLWMGLGLWSWSQIRLWWRDKHKAFNETSF